jgi:hypothetical protein
MDQLDRRLMLHHAVGALRQVHRAHPTVPNNRPKR